MRTTAHGFLIFLLAIAIMVVVLMALNWLPLVMQQDTMRKYDSIQEVQSKLNINDLYVPSYFPQSITWPPSEILAQAKPYYAVLMVFNQAGMHDVALVVTQAASASFSGNEIIKFAQIKEAVPYQLKSRNALLEVGICKKDEPCSRLSWVENKYWITLTMKSLPFELIRIAESMLH